MNTTFVFSSSCPLCWKEHVCPNLISIGRDTIDELPWLPLVGLRTKEQKCIPCEVNKLFWLQRCMEYCRSSSQLGQERSSRLVWSLGIRSCCVGFVVFYCWLDHMWSPNSGRCTLVQLFRVQVRQARGQKSGCQLLASTPPTNVSFEDNLFKKSQMRVNSPWL